MKEVTRRKPSLVVIKLYEGQLLNSFIVITPLGHKVLVNEDAITRLVDKHPELRGHEDLVIRALRDPDEIYRDKSGGFHCLKKIHAVSDYIVVIYVTKNNKGYIKTGYFTSIRRKLRRYRWLERVFSK